MAEFEIEAGIHIPESEIQSERDRVADQFQDIPVSLDADSPGPQPGDLSTGLGRDGPPTPDGGSTGPSSVPVDAPDEIAVGDANLEESEAETPARESLPVETPGPLPVTDPGPLTVADPSPLTVEDVPPVEVRVNAPDAVAVTDPSPPTVADPSPLGVDDPSPLSVASPDEIAVTSPEDAATEDPGEAPVEDAGPIGLADAGALPVEATSPIPVETPDAVPLADDALDVPEELNIGETAGRLDGRRRRRARREFRLSRQRTTLAEEQLKTLEDIEDAVGEGGGGGGLLGGLFGSAGGALGKLGLGAGAGLAGLGVGAGVGLATGDLPEGIGEGLGATLGGAGDFAEGVGEGFGSVIGGTGNFAKDVGEGLGGTVEGFGEGIGSVIEGINPFGDGTSTTISELNSAVFSAGGVSTIETVNTQTVDIAEADVTVRRDRGDRPQPGPGGESPPGDDSDGDGSDDGPLDFLPEPPELPEIPVDTPGPLDVVDPDPFEVVDPSPLPIETPPTIGIEDPDSIPVDAPDSVPLEPVPVPVESAGGEGGASGITVDVMQEAIGADGITQSDTTSVFDPLTIGGPRSDADPFPAVFPDSDETKLGPQPPIQTIPVDDSGGGSGFSFPGNIADILTAGQSFGPAPDERTTGLTGFSDVLGVALNEFGGGGDDGSAAPRGARFEDVQAGGISQETTVEIEQTADASGEFNITIEASFDELQREVSGLEREINDAISELERDVQDEIDGLRRQIRRAN